MGQFYDDEKIKAMEKAAAEASPSPAPPAEEKLGASAPSSSPAPAGRFYDEAKIKALEGRAAPSQQKFKSLGQIALIGLIVIAGLGMLWWKITHNPNTMIVNVNKASATELSYLPGVGPVTAQKIIAGRPYHTIEDLKNVSGIGEKTFEKMKARVKVE